MLLGDLSIPILCEFVDTLAVATLTLSRRLRTCWMIQPLNSLSMDRRSRVTGPLLRYTQSLTHLPFVVH